MAEDRSSPGLLFLLVCYLLALCLAQRASTSSAAQVFALKQQQPQHQHLYQQQQQRQQYQMQQQHKQLQDEHPQRQQQYQQQQQQHEEQQQQQHKQLQDEHPQRQQQYQQQQQQHKQLQDEHPQRQQQYQQQQQHEEQQQQQHKQLQDEHPQRQQQYQQQQQQHKQLLDEHPQRQQQYQQQQQQHEEQQQQQHKQQQQPYEQQQQPDQQEHQQQTREEEGAGGTQVTSHLAAYVGKLTEVKVSTPGDDQSPLLLQGLPPWLLYEDGEGTLLGVPTSQHLGPSTVTFFLPCPSLQHHPCQPVKRVVEIVVLSTSSPHPQEQILADSLQMTSPVLNLTSSELIVLTSTILGVDKRVLLTEPSATTSGLVASSFSDSLYYNPGKVSNDEAKTQMLSTRYLPDYTDDPMSTMKPPENRQCASQHVVSLVLCLTPDTMNTSQRVKVIKQTADFLSIPAITLTWLSSPDGRLLFLDKGYKMESGGASAAYNCTEELHSELFWPLSCSASRHVQEFSKILQHNVQVGRIQREMGVEVVGWYLVSKVIRHRRKRRRVGIRTPIPTPSLYPPSATVLPSSMPQPRFDLTAFESIHSTGVEFSLKLSSTLTEKQTAATVSFEGELFQTESIFSSTAAGGGAILTTAEDVKTLPPTMLLPSESVSSTVTFSVYDKPTPSLGLTSEVISSGKLLSSSITVESISQEETGILIRSGSEWDKTRVITPEIMVMPSDDMMPQSRPPQPTTEPYLSDIIAASKETRRVWRSWDHSSMAQLQSSFLASLTVSALSEKSLTLQPAEVDHPKELGGFTATQCLDSFTLPASDVFMNSFSLSPLQPGLQGGDSVNKTARNDTMTGRLGQVATFPVPVAATIDGSHSFLTQQVRTEVLPITWPPKVSDSTVVRFKASLFGGITSPIVPVSGSQLSGCISTLPAFAVEHSDYSLDAVITGQTWTATSVKGLLSKAETEPSSGSFKGDPPLKGHETVLGFTDQFSRPTVMPDYVDEKITFSNIDQESVSVTELADILTSSGVQETDAAPGSLFVNTSTPFMLTTSSLASGSESTISPSTTWTPTVSSSTISTGQPFTRTIPTSSVSTSTTTSRKISTTTSRKSVFLTTVSVTTPSTSPVRTTVSQQWVTTVPSAPTTSTTVPMRTTAAWKRRKTTAAPKTKATERTTASWWWWKRTTVTPKKSRTTPWWWSTGRIRTTQRSMVLKPATKAPVGIDAPNNPPFLVNSVSYITVMLGTYFEKQIPENMFYDVEDGSTRFLTLTLTLPYDRPLPANFWVQLDSSRQVLVGLPLVADLDMDFNSVVIVATDSQGLGARNPISLYVNTSAFTRFTHRFILKFGVEFGQFMRRRDNMITLMKRIGSYFGDDSASYVTVVDVGMGSLIFSWTNSSLSGSTCWNETIHAFLRRMVRRNGSVRSAFKRHIGKKLRLLHIRYQLEGACLRQAPSPTVTTTTTTVVTSPSTDATTDSPVKGSSSDLITEVILPVLIALLLLLLVMIVILLVYRCRQHSLMEGSNKDLSVADRQPVILQNDIPSAVPYNARPKKPSNLPYEADRQTGSFPRSGCHTYDHYRLSGSLSRNRPNSYTFDDEMMDSRPVTVIFNNFDSLPRQSRPPSYWNDHNEEMPPNIRVPPPYFSTTSV